MKIWSKIIILAVAVICVTGCGLNVSTENMVGLKPYALGDEKFNGIWINEAHHDGYFQIEVTDPEQGLVKITFVNESEDKTKRESVDVQMMKGRSWLYANLIPPPEKSDEPYLWLKAAIDDRKLVFWMPEINAFAGAVRSGEIKGSVKERKTCQEDTGNNVIQLISVHLSDSGEHIAETVENGGARYIKWEKPLFFIRK